MPQETKRRQAEREAEGQAHKAELREQMKKLAEQRQLAESLNASEAKAQPSRALAVALSQVAATSTSSQPQEVAALSDEETEDGEDAPGLVPQGMTDGKVLLKLISPKGDGPAKEQEEPKDQGEEKENEQNGEPSGQLTTGRLEGKTILEQIQPKSRSQSPECLPDRFFGELQAFPIPSRVLKLIASFF